MEGAERVSTDGGGQEKGVVMGWGLEVECGNGT